ncbi:RNA-binding cell elongation regulator Jag/EloR [Actinomarinicola tropica]|uniref:RNA-binding cell elongation regulator Jag/EloR n=1 Tax=Actinomarinicola tropica TaxID=2789776 RepID=UPI001899AE90|nr:RNA-binding cell elongation regulator Jag/EloR [Actinomarinicola tropica]
MEWVETTAKTVDEAKELALDRLGVDEHDAEFEVLEEPRPGLFGRTRGEARVRARVRPVQPRPKADRRDRKRSGRGGGGGGRGSGRRPTDAADEASTTDEEAVPAAPSDEPARPSGEGRRGRGGRGKGGTPRRDAAQTTADRPTDGQEPTMSDDVTVEQQATMVEEFVDGLVAAFGYEGVEVGTRRIDEDTMEVHVEGADLGLLVGPRGATLQAIHDLSRTVVQRQASGHHEGRVRLDVAGYREKRREALTRFTQKVADQVKESGTAQVLEPMAPADRKVVHDTVNEIDGVRTTSEGDEPRRRVVIQPD